MAKPLKVKMNSRGSRAFLRSAEMQADMLRRVQAVQQGCGDGYEADVQPGANRAHGMVKTVTQDAARDNARNNTLLKNLDRGR